jgi:hypothetical protein
MGLGEFRPYPDFSTRLHAGPVVEHLGHEFRAVVNPDPVPNARPLAIGPIIQ